MTEQLNEVRNELKDRAIEPKGLIRINAPVFFGQRHIAPWLSGFLALYPKVQVELTQTDDFIDPHIDAADVIFRIGSLADSTLHARILGVQTYHLAASPAYLKSTVRPKLLAISVAIIAWCIAVIRGKIAGYSKAMQQHGYTKP